MLSLVIDEPVTQQDNIKEYIYLRAIDFLFGGDTVMEIRNKNLEIERTGEVLTYWYDRPYISPKLRKQLSAANVLIVPEEDNSSVNGPVFPSGTDELFSFLKEHCPDGIIPEICIEDGDFRELDLRHDILYICKLAVDYIIAPIIVNILYDYIKYRIANKRDVTLKTQFIISKPDGSAIKYKYNGPAEQFLDVLEAHISILRESSDV